MSTALVAALFFGPAALAAEKVKLTGSSPTLETGQPYVSVPMFLPETTEPMQRTLHIEVVKGDWTPVVTVRPARGSPRVLTDEDPAPDVFQGSFPITDERRVAVEIAASEPGARGKLTWSFTDGPREPWFGEPGFVAPNLSTAEQVFQVEIPEDEALQGNLSMEGVQEVDGFKVMPLAFLLPAGRYELQVRGERWLPLVLWRSGDRHDWLLQRSGNVVTLEVESVPDTPHVLYVSTAAPGLVDTFTLAATQLEAPPQPEQGVIAGEWDSLTPGPWVSTQDRLNGFIGPWRNLDRGATQLVMDKELVRPPEGPAIKIPQNTGQWSPTFQSLPEQPWARVQVARMSTHEGTPVFTLVGPSGQELPGTPRLNFSRVAEWQGFLPEAGEWTVRIEGPKDRQWAMEVDVLRFGATTPEAYPDEDPCSFVSYVFAQSRVGWRPLADEGDDPEAPRWQPPWARSLETHGDHGATALLVSTTGADPLDDTYHELRSDLRACTAEFELQDKAWRGVGDGRTRAQVWTRSGPPDTIPARSFGGRTTAVITLHEDIDRTAGEHTLSLEVRR